MRRPYAHLMQSCVAMCVVEVDIDFRVLCKELSDFAVFAQSSICQQLVLYRLAAAMFVMLLLATFWHYHMAQMFCRLRLYAMLCSACTHANKIANG